MKTKKEYTSTGELKHSVKQKHDAYEFGIIDDSSIHSNITHSNRQGKNKNFPLNRNPDKKDGRPAYLQKQVRVSPKSSLVKNKKGFSVSEEDKRRIEEHYGTKVLNKINKLLNKPKKK